MMPETVEAPATADIPRIPEAAAIPETAAGKGCRLAESSEVLIESGYHQGSAFTWGADRSSKVPTESIPAVNVSARLMYVLIVVMAFPYGAVLVTVALVSLPRYQFTMSLV